MENVKASNSELTEHQNECAELIKAGWGMSSQVGSQSMFIGVVLGMFENSDKAETISIYKKDGEMRVFIQSSDDDLSFAVSDVNDENVTEFSEKIACLVANETYGISEAVH